MFDEQLKKIANNAKSVLDDHASKYFDFHSYKRVISDVFTQDKSNNRILFLFFFLFSFYEKANKLSLSLKFILQDSYCTSDSMYTHKI